MVKSLQLSNPNLSELEYIDFSELASVGCSKQTNVVLGFIRPVRFVVLEMGIEMAASTWECTTDILRKLK